MKLDVENEYNARYLAMLQQWKCHKVVQAGKISLMAADQEKGVLMIHAQPSNMPFSVPLDFLQRHSPEIGGYFVVYEDGYLSYSPADAFELGYRHVEPLGSSCGSVGGEAAADQDAKAVPASSGFQWRKKPVVIEAFLWTGDKDQGGEPEWIVDAIKDGKVLISSEGMHIETLEGIHLANFGDWIIRGIKGELYPCKPDIFAATYEPADAPALDPKHAISLAVGHAEKLAYDYAHVLPEGDERDLALQVYHRIRLVFSNGKSGMGGHATNLIGSVGGPEAVPDIDLNAADFSDALMWLKEGKRVQRAGWNGANQWVEELKNSGLVFRSEHDNTAFSVADGLVLKNAQGIVVQWAPSIGDLMAADWQVVGKNVDEPSYRAVSADGRETLHFVTHTLPHQRRVIEEYNQLYKHHKDLTKFFDTELYSSLSIDERNRLKEQSLFMTEYQRVLLERIRAF